MDRSAIILLGSSVNRFNYDENLPKFNGKPLINYSIEAVKDLVNEIVLVVDYQECNERYKKYISSNIKIEVNGCESKSPLAGALKGFESVNGDYTVLLLAKNPFVSKEVLALLFECCIGKSAAIPKDPNIEIASLHAVYNTKKAFEAAKEAFEENEEDIEKMVDKLRGVRYISTMVLKQLDPDLRFFKQH